MSDEEDESGDNQPGRIFINNLDNYLSKNLAIHLASSKPGQILDEDEEDENEGEESLREPETQKGLQFKGYTIIGTVANPLSQKPMFAETILTYDDRRSFYEHIFECDTIVYDISSDESQIDEAFWVASSLAEDVKNFRGKKTFILVTHLLSWLRTKPIDPDNVHPTFSEDENRRRKPHPLYTHHFDVERTIIKLGKKHRNKFSTYILACGIPYGAGECIFEPYFRMAWMNSLYLEVYGNGENLVPTIHIKDFSSIIQTIIETTPDVKYIVAKDDNESTLGEIIMAISGYFSTGEVQHISMVDVDKIFDIPRFHIDQLTMDMSIENPTVKEDMALNWKSETGIVDNIEMLAKEYLTHRNLQPRRICVLGPPYVGKTTLALELAKRYGLHYIHITPVLYEVYNRLRKPLKVLGARWEEENEKKMLEVMNARQEKARRAVLEEQLAKDASELLDDKPQPLFRTATSQDVQDEQLSLSNLPAETERTISSVSDLPLDRPKVYSPPPNSTTTLFDSLPEDVVERFPLYPPVTWTEEEFEETVQESEDELAELVRSTSSEMRVDDAIVCYYLRRKLMSKPCLNQGFVLDGWPKTREQAELLCSTEDDGDGEQNEKNPTWDPLITPNHLIYLEASNNLCTHRFKEHLAADGIYEDLEVPSLGLPFDLFSVRQDDEGIEKPKTTTTTGEKTLPSGILAKLKALKIDWFPPYEAPEHILLRRLEAHRSIMAPQAAADILDDLLAGTESEMSESDRKKVPLKKIGEQIVRKPLPPSKLDPMEENVLTYFDVREIHPLVVNVDRDNSQRIYEKGPQIDTVENVVRFIGLSPAVDFMRQLNATPFVGIDEFQENCVSEAIEKFERRLEEADILSEKEDYIWHDWLMLLKQENEQRCEAMHVPRRNYLLQYVLPKVTQCLVLFGEKRPQDPIDFLAEYLLRNEQRIHQVSNTSF